MRVRVRFVGGLRDRFQTEFEFVAIEFASPTVAALRETLANRGGPWAVLVDPSYRAAVNYSHSRPGNVLCEGDEVTFFPPV